MITRRSLAFIPHSVLHSDSSSLFFFFFFAKKKRRNKRKRKEKVVSPGCDSWKERRPNRVFGAFVLIPKFGTLNRGAVLKVLAAGNGGRRIIPAMFHAMRLTACAR